MTRITVYREYREQERARRREWRFYLRAEGHATGSAAVCAGVSALVFALAGWLHNAGDAAAEQDMRLASGDAELAFSGTAAAIAAFDMAVIGLAQIAKQHPEQLEIRIAGPAGRRATRGA